MGINHKRILKVYTKYFFYIDNYKHSDLKYLRFVFDKSNEMRNCISNNYCTRVRTTKFPATNFPQYCCALNFGYMYETLLRKQVTNPVILFKNFT